MTASQIREAMGNLGIKIESGGEYPLKESVDKWVDLQRLMREWFLYEMDKGNFQFSDTELERMEKHHGVVGEWRSDYLDESIEEWLVG